MSEFKFSCPNCQQSISATTEYSGVQINCPACNTPLIVPPSPDSSTGAPGPVAVPQGTKLTKAPTTSHSTATPFVSQAAPVRRKKSHKELYIWLGSGACAIVCIIIFWHPLAGLFAKYVPHPAPAAPVIDTNVPPPPPPELATDEILQNVRDKYNSLSTYAVKGQSTASVDVSGIRPGLGLQTSSQAVSLELGRTNLYRLEWQRTQPAQPLYKGAAWSAGKGDYVGYGPYPATKMKNRETAMATAETASEAMCVSLVQLFFNETNSIARQAEAFAKTNGPNVATRINNRDCYVLDGQFNAHDLVIWIDKGSFLIQQIQFIFGGKLDDSNFKEMRPTERNQLTTWSKLKGSITETYGGPDVDKTLAAATFEAPFSPIMSAADTAAAGQAPPARQRPRGASPTSPTQLTRRVRPEQ
jgi:hypothetical protein